MNFSMIILSLSALEAILKFIYNAKTILKTLENISTKMKLKMIKMKFKPRRWLLLSIASVIFEMKNKYKIDKCHDWIACRSTLCDDEKASVIEELSRVISNELGLREQLEVIRIINPSAEVSPTDKEFVIG